MLNKGTGFIPNINNTKTKTGYIKRFITFKCSITEQGGHSNGLFT